MATPSSNEITTTRELAQRLQQLQGRLQKGTAKARLDIIYPAELAEHLYDKLVGSNDVFDWYLNLDDDNAGIFITAY